MGRQVVRWLAVVMFAAAPAAAPQRTPGAPALERDDFDLFEDGERQTITHFTSERVPVSLTVPLDTSDSMFGQRLRDARAAIERFVTGLLEQGDGPINPAALAEITDQSGGRTKVVHGSADLGTARDDIAAELNHQYLIGYSSSHDDGREVSQHPAPPPRPWQRVPRPRAQWLRRRREIVRIAAPSPQPSH